MTKKIAAFLLGLMLIPGCALIQSVTLQGGSLIVYPSVADKLTTQANVVPITKDTINHVRMELFTVDANQNESPVMSGGNPVTADILKAELDKGVQFNRLKAETKYRVKAFAYKAAGTAAGDLISETASSSTDIVMQREDRPTIAQLKLWLKDVYFVGEATSTIGVDDSEMVDKQPENVN